MKTLINQTLLYDEECPLCQVYTSGFIKAKMLDKSGRKPFNHLSKEELNFVDVNRATNEIALIDNKNKTVIYGIDSLLKVIGNSFPFIEKIGYIRPIHFLLRKLYSFISYNRKVVIPRKANKNVKLSCIPDFNTKYRILYILFSILITTLVLFKFSNLVLLLPESTFGRELILTLGQILFQSAFLIKQKKESTLNYIGNLMTVSLMGSLILIPLLIINSITNLATPIILIWFGTIVLIMFLEHFRRIKTLELPSYLSYTWAIYRIIALLIILNI